jgi:hypothetical protein
VIAATLDGLRERYGSVDEYLTERAGIGPATLDKFRTPVKLTRLQLKKPGARTNKRPVRTSKRPVRTGKDR